MRLSEAIEEYLASRTTTGYAKNTTKVERRALDCLLEVAGNIQLRSLDARHGDQYVAALLSKGFKPATLNLYRGVLRRFCDWAQKRRYLTQGTVLLMNTRSFAVADKPRRRIPARDFSRLLDAAEHPQERIIVALGLFLFLRASEVSGLDVQQVDLAAGEIQVFLPKVKRWDVMPICEELDTELRRLLTWYAEDAREKYGPLVPHWPLVPARNKMSMVNDGTGRGGGRPVIPEFGQMNPRRRIGLVHVKVQKVLRAFGWEVTADDREGVHTLRRSGARALFDQLVSAGEVRDGVLRIVQAMLHHKSVTITEHYLGLEADREKRDEVFKGRRMFPSADDNVVELRRDA